MIYPLFAFLLAHQQSEPSYPPLIPPTEEEHAKALELWNLARKSHGLDRTFGYRIGYVQETRGNNGGEYYDVVYRGSYAQEHCVRYKNSGIGDDFISEHVTYDDLFNLPRELPTEEQRSQAIRFLSYPASFLQLKPENITRPVDGYGFEVHRDGITIRVFLNKGTNDVNRVQYQKFVSGNLKWITKKYFMAAFTFSKHYLPQAWTIDDGEGNFGPMFKVTVVDDGESSR
ncbi:MAG: hypothetical protein KF824_11460 [Fimbriimonadaceae bacterium]|nr:MAG: hypothetical protein KF824_11460 [Fimbriimonadaceae bacterium]